MPHHPARRRSSPLPERYAPGERTASKLPVSPARARQAVDYLDHRGGGAQNCSAFDNVGGMAGPKATMVLPGSGLSYTEHLHREPSPGQQPAQTSGFGRVLLIVLVLVLVTIAAVFGWA